MDRSHLMGNETELENIVNKALKEFQVPGAAVAVTVQGKVILCRGFGVRDIENNLPVTENTLFSIASNTKPFTGFLISQLVEEGKLNWDEPIIKYLPEFRMFNDELTENVTLRDLIAHRTGIPRHDALWYLIRDLNEEDVISILPHLEPVFKFRESFLYNNLMYVVAGKVIGKMTNSTWEEQIFSRIFKPLEMNSSFTTNSFAEEDNFAQPYAEMGGKIQKISFLYPSSTLAASGISSSVSDMVKWLKVQLSCETCSLIEKKSIEELHSIHMPISANTVSGVCGYGLGWEIKSYRQKKEVHHGGVLEGFISEVSLLPDEKIGIVILTNSSTGGRYAVECIKNCIYDYYLRINEEDWFQVFGEKYKNSIQNLSPSLQKYEGFYSHPVYGNMEIKLEYDSLIATLGKMKIQLHQKSDGVFEAKYPALLTYGVNPIVEFSFLTDSLGEVIELHVPFEHFRAAPPIIFKK